MSITNPNCQVISPRYCLQAVEIEGMERLTPFQHNVIGDIHHIVNRSHPGVQQALLQPPRRRANFNPGEHRSYVGQAWVGLGYFDL